MSEHISSILYQLSKFSHDLGIVYGITVLVYLALYIITLRIVSPECRKVRPELVIMLPFGAFYIIYCCTCTAEAIHEEFKRRKVIVNTNRLKIAGVLNTVLLIAALISDTLLTIVSALVLLLMVYYIKQLIAYKKQLDNIAR